MAIPSDGSGADRVFLAEPIGTAGLNRNST